MEDYTYIPEKALGLAIISRAVLDALGQTALAGGIINTQKGYLIRQARAWLFSAYDDQRKTPFSFPWWCEVLEVDKNRIRKFVLSGVTGKVTTNRMDDLNHYLKVYDDHTSAPYQLAL